MVWTLVLDEDSVYEPDWDFKDEPVDIDAAKPYLQEKQAKLNKIWTKIEKLISDIPFEVMRQEEIFEFLWLNKLNNFIDPHFPPHELSLFNPSKEKYPFPYLAHWRRPLEFLEGQIYLF